MSTNDDKYRDLEEQLKIVVAMTPVMQAQVKKLESGESLNPVDDEKALLVMQEGVRTLELLKTILKEEIAKAAVLLREALYYLDSEDEELQKVGAETTNLIRPRLATQLKQMIRVDTLLPAARHIVAKMEEHTGITIAEA